MKTPRFSGPFKWSALRQQLLSLREDLQSIEKLPGHNVTIDEHRDKGKVINVQSDTSRRPTGGGGVGACCYDDGTCDNLTESDCTEAGGNWQGEDTTCDDTGICVGACCEGEYGTTCVDDSTPDSCAADGGTWTDFGITCDSNPCELPPCNGCGFEAFDGSGRMFLTRTTTYTEHDPICCVGSETHDAQVDAACTVVQRYDASCNLSSDTSGTDDLSYCNGDVVHLGCYVDPDASRPYTVMSAIYRVWDHTHPCGYEPTCPDLTCVVIYDQTLSDECLPGFMPPP